MSIDERLRAGLAELADRAVPAADPLEQLIRRSRNQRRVRVAGAAGTAVATAALLVAAITLLPGPGPAPREADGTSATDVAGWTQRVMRAAPRGAVAAQPGFVDQLTAALIQQAQTGDTDPNLVGGHDDDPLPPSLRSIRVLFVDDVADLRVAAVAMPPIAPDDGHDTYVAWLVAPAGASVAALAGTIRPAAARAAGTELLVGGPGPTLVQEIPPPGLDQPGPTALVVLAPPGCTMASAPLPAVTDWRAEPTGSYLLRTGPQRRAEWWRATCGGVVRAQEPAPVILDPANPDTVNYTDAQAQAAMVGARRPAPVAATRNAMSLLSAQAGYTLASSPVLVWSGPVAGLTEYGATRSTGDTIVVAAPLVGGGWTGIVTTEFTAEVAGEPSTIFAWSGSFVTEGDPRDPGAVVAVPLTPNYVQGSPADPATLLVLAPAGAVTVRATQDDLTLAESAVADGAAVLTVQTVPGAAAGFVVEALDAGRTPLQRTTPLGQVFTRDGVISHWDS